MIKVLLFGLFILSYLGAFGQGKEKSENFLQSIERGAIIYEDFCMNCHMPDGSGVEKINPPLTLLDNKANYREKSIKAVKYGQSGGVIVNGKSYNGVMAAMGLSDKEVADVMNYISTNFGNKNDKIFTEAEVLKIVE